MQIEIKYLSEWLEKENIGGITLGIYLSKYDPQYIEQWFEMSKYRDDDHNSVYNRLIYMLNECRYSRYEGIRSCEKCIDIIKAYEPTQEYLDILLDSIDLFNECLENHLCKVSCMDTHIEYFLVNQGKYNYKNDYFITCPITRSIFFNDLGFFYEHLLSKVLKDNDTGRILTDQVTIYKQSIEVYNENVKRSRKMNDEDIIILMGQRQIYRLNYDLIDKILAYLWNLLKFRISLLYDKSMRIDSNFLRAPITVKGTNKRRIRQMKFLRKMVLKRLSDDRWRMGDREKYKYGSVLPIITSLLVSMKELMDFKQTTFYKK